MLTSTIDFSDANDYLSENMKKAIAFLRDNDLDALPLGRTEIKGDDVFANVMEYETVDADEKDMEAHKLYYDVQFVVRGEEALYVAPLDGLSETQPFDDENDFGLYSTPDYASRIYLRAGELSIAAPEDAHKPGCHAKGACLVRKIVVKVHV